jgi:transposase
VGRIKWDVDGERRQRGRRRHGRAAVGRHAPWLRKHPRLQVLHGARYSPHDNPVEWIWGALKAWLANSPTLTIQGRVRQVHGFFRERTPQQMLTTAAPHSSPWLPDGYVQHLRQAA